MAFNQPQGFKDRRGGDFPPLPALPVGYLKNGYFDDKGNPLPQIMQEWPKFIADALFKSRPRITSTQLRRFFSEVRRLEKELSATNSFDMVKPQILKLKAYAEDARKKDKVPDLFKQFIEENVHKASISSEAFKNGFVNHFECVVAYYPEVRGN